MKDLIRGFQAQILIVALASSWAANALALPAEFRSKTVHCETDGPCDLFFKQWNMVNTLTHNPWGAPISQPRDINIASTWAQGITGDRSIIVAVIDSGVDIQHPDLKDNIFVSKGEIPNNGIDDDGNGYIDDVNGWNFSTQNSDVSDTVGHGTHIAGVIGARGDNDFGVKGINWNVTILPIVYLDKEGNGNLKNSIDAIKYAVNMGARIINASWGGYSPDALRDAILWAGSRGVLFVNSSGNDGENLDIYPYYPASFALDNMIVVGSSEFNDGLTGDSNWGKNTVDILAPGLEILSTLPGNSYGYMSGTSMSAPHVAGVAALLWSIHPDWTYSQIKAALLDSSHIESSYRNKVSYGRLDVEACFDGISNGRFFPAAWQKVSKNQAFHFEKAGVHHLIVKSPGARALRINFGSLKLLPRTQRILVNDGDGTSVQKFTSLQDLSTTDYVFGDTMDLTFILDEDSDLDGTIESLEVSL